MEDTNVAKRSRLMSSLEPYYNVLYYEESSILPVVFLTKKKYWVEPSLGSSYKLKVLHSLRIKDLEDR